MMTDPIAEMLTRIRNALMMSHPQVVVPYSRLKESVLNLLKQEGFFQDVEVVGEANKKALVVQLKYTALGKGVISVLKRVSKPSLRRYSGYEELASGGERMRVKILTTSKGILSEAQARRKRVGGEVLLEVW